MGHYVSTKQFSYDKASKTFTTCISDLGKNFDTIQIYPDACDEGFIMVSDKTGREEKFAKNSDITNREGEVMGWTFIGLNKKLGLKVNIYND